MKKHLLTMTVLMISTLAFAQNTEILPGIVLPQMTTTQRNAISSPKNGMLVFDTNTQSYWYRKSGTWTELNQGGGGSEYWQLSGMGNTIKNTNTGGFWSANAVGLSDISDDISNPPTAPVSGNGTRLMWIPSRSAFRVGTVTDNTQSWNASNIGLFSFASGVNTEASGKYSTAMGVKTKASGRFSTAMGTETKASGNQSTAMGFLTTASGSLSTAMGTETKASGNQSTAMGFATTASGSLSTAMGFLTTASGEASTAMGKVTKANGNNSTAIGYYTIASGNYSFSGGYYSEALADYSFVYGSNIRLTNAASGSMYLADNYRLVSIDQRITPNRFYARFDNGYYIYTNGTGDYGVFMEHNGNAWSTISDSTKKENFKPMDKTALLNGVRNLKLGTWNYKGQDPAVYRHYGPMAQEFYHYFGKDELGVIGNDTTINSADMDGVLMTAIQALIEENDRLKGEVGELKRENQKALAKVSSLENKVSKIDELEANIRELHAIILRNERVRSKE